MQFRYDDMTIAVNIPTRTALEAAVTARWAAGEGFALATINLDHLAKLDTDPAFVAAYAAQDFVVADGWPIVTLSKVSGHPVELMPGSELVEPMSAWAAKAGVKLGLVGSHDRALADAKAALEARTPGLEIVYTNAPAMGFDPVLLETGVRTHLPGRVRHHLLEGYHQRLALGVRHRPLDVLGDEAVGGVHPVEGLVGTAVGVDRHAAVGFDHDQPHRGREVAGEPALVVNRTTGDDEAHGTPW